MRTILIWFQDGGPFIAPLLLLGLVGLLLLAERIVFITIRSKIHARPFIEKVLSLVRGGKLEEALTLCADHQAALADLGLIILRSRSRNEGDLASLARSATSTILPALTRRLLWLKALSIIAVLMGLVGAVANLHDALLRSTPMPLGLALALRPLGVGLITSIPLVLGHAFLVSESRKLATQLDEFALRLINALIDRPDVRLGHRN